MASASIKSVTLEINSSDWNTNKNPSTNNNWHISNDIVTDKNTLLSSGTYTLGNIISTLTDGAVYLLAEYGFKVESSTDVTIDSFTAEGITWHFGHGKDTLTDRWIPSRTIHRISHKSTYNEWNVKSSTNSIISNRDKLIVKGNINSTFTLGRYPTYSPVVDLSNLAENMDIVTSSDVTYQIKVYYDNGRNSLFTTVSTHASDWIKNKDIHAKIWWVSRPLPHIDSFVNVSLKEIIDDIGGHYCIGYGFLHNFGQNTGNTIVREFRARGLTYRFGQAKGNEISVKASTIAPDESSYLDWHLQRGALSDIDTEDTEKLVIYNNNPSDSNIHIIKGDPVNLQEWSLENLAKSLYIDFENSNIVLQLPIYYGYPLTPKNPPPVLYTEVYNTDIVSMIKGEELLIDVPLYIHGEKVISVYNLQTTTRISAIMYDLWVPPANGWSKKLFQTSSGKYYIG